MWFASGALMLFESFPSLPASERLAHGEAIDFARVNIEPEAALNAAPEATTLKLVSQAGQPIYIAGGKGNIVINASSGIRQPALDAATAQAIAERFGGAIAKRVDTNINYDQWVVHQGFDGGRPYYRVSLDDNADTVLYVASRSGEVAQRTTRQQRLLNIGGAVLHWIYFTPVRQDWSLWDQLVWWMSLLALLGASTGMVVGVYRFVQARRFKGAGFGTFRGWMRWHHILGVCAGSFLLCWILSGWLSMDHGRLFSRGGASDVELARFQGQSLTQAIKQISLTDLQTFAGSGATELSFNSLSGQSFVLAQGGTAPRIRLAGNAAILSSLPDSLLLAAAHSAWPKANIVLHAPTQQADFYARAEGTPGNARVLSITDRQVRRVYVDAHSGEVSALLDSSRRAYAWVYYALHTYQLPGLAEHNALRISVMLCLLSAGFSLSITGVVLAYKHLAR